MWWKWVLILIIPVILMFTGCSTNNVPVFTVNVGFKPSNPVAGDEVTLWAEVDPKPFANMDSSLELKVGSMTLVENSDHIERTLTLPEGTYSISASFTYGGRSYESGSVILVVRSLSEKYEVNIGVPEETVIGSGANVLVFVTPVPSFENWRVDVLVDGGIRTTLRSSNLLDGSEEVLLDLEPGMHVLQAVMRSPYGEVFSEEATVEVLDNSPPSIESVEVFPSTPVADSDVYFMVRVREDEGYVESIRLYIDGRLVGYDTPLGDLGVLVARGLEEGEHEAIVIAENSSGYSTSVSIDLNVQPHDLVPPDVSLSLQKFVFAVGENVAVGIRITDDGGIAGYEVLLDGDPVESRNLGGRKSFDGEVVLSDLSEGFHRLRVRAWDIIGRESFKSQDFYVSDRVVYIKLFVDNTTPKDGEIVTFYFGLRNLPDASISSLQLLVDSSPIYEFTGDSTESLRPYINWRATAGYHRVRLLLRTVDGKYGMDAMNLSVEDVTPPGVVALYVNGTIIGDDPASPTRVEAGAHRVRIHVRDDSELRRDDYVLMDVYDIDGEDRLLQTLVVPQYEISRDLKEATYAINLNFPIGRYKLSIKNLEDAAGNEAEVCDFYMIVSY